MLQCYKRLSHSTVAYLAHSISLTLLQPQYLSDTSLQYVNCETDPLHFGKPS